jgi:hypothetical protein
MSILSISCIETDCCVLVPELAEFHGEWKLEKITNGFAQLELIGLEAIGYKEIISIDASNQTFTSQIGNFPQEKSKLELGIQANQDALILVDENMYHWYSFQQLNGKTYLMLYQKCPINAVLADGSYYYYSKQ